MIVKRITGAGGSKKHKEHNNYLCTYLGKHVINLISTHLNDADNFTVMPINNKVVKNIILLLNSIHN